MAFTDTNQPGVTESVPGLAKRRLRRMAVRGPRCPHCVGPLVSGEGAQLCPVCGYTASV